jgi:uncharacterized protein
MRKILSIFAILLIVFGISVLGLYAFSSDDLDVITYDFTSDEVPPGFDGFTIVQLTDMHNHSVDYANTNILDEIDAIHPDVVLVTGDMIDSYTNNLVNLTALFEGLQLYTTYYVNGNHEVTSSFYSEFFELSRAYNLYDLNRTMTDITRGDETIHFIGVDDAMLAQKGLFGYEDTGLIKDNIETLTTGLDDDELTIVLSHRPSLYQNYIDTGMDLVFSGHYHGSQVRLFGFGFAQLLHGWYEGAKTEIDGTTFITSAGLGYAVAPIRVNCHAQLVVTKLHSA